MRRFVFALALVAPNVAAEPSPVRDARSPDIFCLERIDETKIAYFKPLFSIYQSLADVCELAQPQLAQAAREASVFPTTTSQQAKILFRAARRHPAFPKECDIDERKADLIASKAFEGRAGCSDAAHQPGVLAGTYVYMIVLTRVAWPRTEPPPDFLKAWVAMEQYERWKEGKLPELYHHR